MMQSDDTTRVVNDALDALQRAVDLLHYVIINQDPDTTEPGEGWTIGAAEDGIRHAMTLLNSIKENPTLEATL